MQLSFKIKNKETNKYVSGMEELLKLLQNELAYLGEIFLLQDGKYKVEVLSFNRWAPAHGWY